MPGVPSARSKPIVIAHRGASGYLPEHTLVSKALAVGMGADYLEQDVVATRDGQLIVFHDLFLERTTDVATRYRDRRRADGHFYCVDFTLRELRELTIGERKSADGSGPRYPGRFPDDGVRFPIPTLEEELQFIQGLRRSTGRAIGIYPEIKNPSWHRAHGIDLGRRLLDTLHAFGYRDRDDPTFVQCFDAVELQRLRGDLGCRLRLVLLLEGEGNAPDVAALREMARYADAIGPPLRLVLGDPAKGFRPADGTGLVRDAHGVGLAVHPYTFRADDLPDGFKRLEDLFQLVLIDLCADGAFTDFPDIAARFLGGCPA